MPMLFTGNSPPTSQIHRLNSYNNENLRIKAKFRRNFEHKLQADHTNFKISTKEQVVAQNEVRFTFRSAFFVLKHNFCFSIL